MDFAEEREQQGKAVWELAVIEERESGRRTEKEEEERDVMRGVSGEKESSEMWADIWVSEDVCPECGGEVFLSCRCVSSEKWADVWASDVCLECQGEIFLGCKCGKGALRVSSTRTREAEVPKERGDKGRADSGGWRDRDTQAVVLKKKRDEGKRQDDSDGWGREREVRRREWQGGAWRHND